MSCVHSPTLAKESLFSVSEKLKQHLNLTHWLPLMISPWMIVPLVIFPTSVLPLSSHQLCDHGEEENEGDDEKYVLQFGLSHSKFRQSSGSNVFSAWSSNSSGCKCWFYLPLHKNSSTLLLLHGNPFFCTSVPIDDLGRCFPL